MSASTVITTSMLALAGVTGDLAAALEGLTVAEAADVYIDTLQIAIGAAQIARRSMVSYTIEGQAVQTSIDDAAKTIAFLQRMKSDRGRGPIALPVTFRALT